MSAARFAAAAGAVAAAASLSVAASDAGTAAQAADAFIADFPNASVARAAGGGWLTRASGFSGESGATPEAAAMAFLAKHGLAFGVIPRERLVAHAAGGTVHVERQIDGLPLFDGDLVLGLGASNAVVIVNSAVVPPRIEGAFRCSRRRARRSAVRALPGESASDAPQLQQGWKANTDAIRPVWRVRVGEWSVDVDGETCVVMAKRSERVEADRPGGIR